MKAVRLERNADGTWTAWIFSTSFRGTYENAATGCEATASRRPDPLHAAGLAVG
jgi:hypothetical protein